MLLCHICVCHRNLLLSPSCLCFIFLSWPYWCQSNCPDMPHAPVWPHPHLHPFVVPGGFSHQDIRHQSAGGDLQVFLSTDILFSQIKLSWVSACQSLFQCRRHSLQLRVWPSLIIICILCLYFRVLSFSNIIIALVTHYDLDFQWWVKTLAVSVSCY